MITNRNKILSFSIAAYNVEDTISETLKSIVSMKYVDLVEIIVTNDGSQDGTQNLIEKFEKQYPDIIKIVNKSNGGHGSTINSGIENATGKYFKVLDGDDWVETERMDEYVQTLQNTEADVVLTDYVLCFPDGRKINDSSHVLLDGKVHSVNDLINSRSLSMHEITVKTDILKENHVKIIEKCFYVDRQFLHEVILNSETIMELSYPIYNYRIGATGQSVSPNNRVHRIGDQINVLHELLKLRENKISQLSDEKKKFSYNDISGMIMYIITSYSYADLKKHKEIKKKLMTFMGNLNQSFTSFEMNPHIIAFGITPNLSLKRRILFRYQEMMIKYDFFGFLPFSILKHYQARKEGW